MSLERVYASKLYRVSKNKDAIKSAFENPSNTQLVQQLFNQVDDKYKKLDDIKNDDANVENEVEVNDASESAAPASENRGSAPSTNRHYSAPMNFEPSEVPGEMIDDDDQDLSDEEDVDVPDTDIPDDDDNSEDVSESTKTSGQSVEAAKALYTIAEKTHDFKSDCDVLKGTLNSRQDTSGVTRTSVKDNEMWLYYNDSINLNNVMAQVIDVVSNAGYNYLEFNRLARSDNAIVFEINVDTSSKEDENEDEEK